MSTTAHFHTWIDYVIKSSSSISFSFFHMARHSRYWLTRHKNKFDIRNRTKMMHRERDKATLHLERFRVGLLITSSCPASFASPSPPQLLAQLQASLAAFARSFHARPYPAGCDRQHTCQLSLAWNPRQSPSRSTVIVVKWIKVLNNLTLIFENVWLIFQTLILSKKVKLTLKDS